MPLYDYACTKCGRIREVRHGFNESHEEPCETCGAPLRRVFSAAPVLFKGSGFYVTDSRRSASASTVEKPKSEASSGPAAKPDAPASSDPKSEPKTGSKTSESAA